MSVLITIDQRIEDLVIRFDGNWQSILNHCIAQHRKNPADGNGYQAQQRWHWGAVIEEVQNRIRQDESARAEWQFERMREDRMAYDDPKEFQ